MKLGIIYSGEKLEPRSFRALTHIGIIEGIEVTQLIDASTHAGSEDQERVQNVGKFLRIEPERPSEVDFEAFDALIIEVGSNARFQLSSVISHAVDTAVHLHLPYDALTTLPFADVIDLYKRAESNGVWILACSRFLFGQVYTRFREKITSFEFGGLSDLSFRIGIGPVLEDRQLLRFGMHHLNILFDLLREKPVGLSVVGNSDQVSQPCVNFTLRFASGEIANFFLTANRAWGVPYHWIEVSGRNSYAVTDLVTRRYRTSIDTATQVSEINDDDQAPSLYGSAGKISSIVSAARSDAFDVEAVSHFSKLTKRSLWVYEMLREILSTGDSIATRTFSNDTPDGWQ